MRYFTQLARRQADRQTDSETDRLTDWRADSQSHLEISTEKSPHAFKTVTQTSGLPRAGRTKENNNNDDDEMMKKKIQNENENEKLSATR